MIIKISKPYEVKNIDSIIKTTTTNIVKLNFSCYNKSIYKNTIEVIYTLEIPINLISIEEFQFDNIIYNRFNHSFKFKMSLSFVL